jgi:hypothetical protein
MNNVTQIQGDLKMSSNVKRRNVPALAISFLTIGTGWLLTTLKVVPGVNWIWVLGLAFVGMITPIRAGLDKLTAVVGPFLVVAAGCAFLRQLEWMPLKIEAPVLVMTAGALLFITHFVKLPAPAWLLDDAPAAS